MTVSSTRSSPTTLATLVDRLLSRPISDSDNKFRSTFLCLYRKFAAPAQLLSQILLRFDILCANKFNPPLPDLSRLSTLYRVLTVLVEWLSDYPGDFAHPVTRLQLSTFAHRIGMQPDFAIAAQEITLQLEELREDDDTDWACSDKGRVRASTTSSFPSVPIVRMGLAVTQLSLDHDSKQQQQQQQTLGQARDEAVVRPSTSGDGSSRDSEMSGMTRSVTNEMPDAGGLGTQLVADATSLLHPFESAQRAAGRLYRPTRSPLKKEHWQIFMDATVDDIVWEMTREDWVMFAAIKPRDLIRHISMSGEQRAACSGLEYVNLMVNHFNHVASWVAEMVLLRDKVKHRAQTLEKFMTIAWVGTSLGPSLSISPSQPFDIWPSLVGPALE